MKSETTEHTHPKTRSGRRNSIAETLETHAFHWRFSAVTKVSCFLLTLRLLYAIRRPRLPRLGLIPYLHASSRRAGGGSLIYYPLFQKGGHVYVLCWCAIGMPLGRDLMTTELRGGHGSGLWCCVVVTYDDRKLIPFGPTGTKGKVPSLTVNLFMLGLACRSSQLCWCEQANNNRFQLEPEACARRRVIPIFLTGLVTGGRPSGDLPPKLIHVSYPYVFATLAPGLAVRCEVG